ncbi:hypothetical protein DPMN_169476 [Dreissena polymorpha]|uniref:Uncharacterized protein n=1 Tax=Dreissena polymorpha TaxID=45954 RepID=A0A9D4DUQ9_DREPO|nr:hypothetical protein DPMN_169476 [Dreissena polymorpha]
MRPKTNTQTRKAKQAYPDEMSATRMSFVDIHDDCAKDVISRVHVIQMTGTIFELNSHIKKTNVLTNFHGNWAKNVTSRVFTCFHNIHIEKNASLTGGHGKLPQPTGGHVFQRTGITFELNQHIIKTNILTNIHPDGDFIWTKLLTKFHEDRT